MSYANYYPSSGMFHASLPLLMGTRLDILLFGDDKEHLEHIWECTEMELKRLEMMLNRYDPKSEVAMINNKAPHAEVQLSDELWHIIHDCSQYYNKTDGFFDVTYTCFDHIILMGKTHAIRFDREDMILDFGGYAKGYALKCVQQKLREAEIKRAFVNFGNSSVLAFGTHPYGDSWSIQIDNTSDANELSSIKLCNTSFSVSGNSLDRKKHIINPKTAEYIIGDAMVAVVAKDPLDAEVLTTAWMASGYQKEPGWMSEFNIETSYRIK
jgi:Membrane-associated lipoprotein involved in thiamine biosynthesis